MYHGAKFPECECALTKQMFGMGNGGPEPGFPKEVQSEVIHYMLPKFHSNCKRAGGSKKEQAFIHFARKCGTSIQVCYRPGSTHVVSLARRRGFKLAIRKIITEVQKVKEEMSLTGLLTFA